MFEPAKLPAFVTATAMATAISGAQMIHVAAQTIWFGIRAGPAGAVLLALAAGICVEPGKYG